MTKSITNPIVSCSCDGMQEVAEILAAAYLRLIRMRLSNTPENGQFGENCPQKRHPKRFDFRGNQRNELEPG